MIYLIMSIALACNFEQEQAIRCDQNCISKGFSQSWYKDKKCICGDVSEMDKPIFKVPSNMKVKNLDEKKSNYDD